MPKNVEKSEKWIQSLNFENTVTQKRKFREICEEHFNENDIIHNAKRKRLKKNSLPMAKLNFLIKDFNCDQLVEEVVEIIYLNKNYF
jgi:hypothetical protein